MSPFKSDQPDLLHRSSGGQSIEDLSQELQEQQERLLELRRQQEEVERRKTELEDLNKRRSELSIGQKTMRERLTRAITVLERSEYESRREIEQLQIIRETFNDHLGQIEGISPGAWTPETIDEELTKALSKIDHAQSIYNQSRAKIDALSGRDITDGSNTEVDDEDTDRASSESEVPFAELVRRGFALSLPLILILAMLGFLILIKF
jgi:molecular chaperone GrpE (heat shock protein)